MSAGNKKSLGISPVIYEALTKAAAHNPNVTLSNGSALIGSRELGSSLQQEKFVVGLLGCSPDDQHFGFRTLHSIKGQEQLLCYYCLGDNKEVWDSKKKGSSHEDAFIRVCKERGWLGELAWQVRLRWWDGPIDFLHFPTRTAFQIDGEGHFTGQYGESRDVILKRDISCCLKAISAGAKMVRISHQDMVDSRVAIMVQEAIESQQPSFIMVSAAYRTAGWGVGEARRWYMNELLEGIQQQHPLCSNSIKGQAGCTWITW